MIHSMLDPSFSNYRCHILHRGSELGTSLWIRVGYTHRIIDDRMEKYSSFFRFREDIRKKRDSGQCDTAPSWTTRSITLRQVRLSAVSHCAESGN